MADKDKPVHVKLIANTNAKKIRTSSAILEEAVRQLSDLGMKVDVVLAHPKRKATPIVRKAIKEGYDAVIALGGDGTIDAVIDGLVGSKMRLGIIPGGTSNDIARSLGIPEDIQEACALIASGHTRKLDLGQVSTKKKKKAYFFMVTAIGVVATVYPMINQVPEGKFTGITDAVKTFLDYDSKPTVYLTLDGESKVKVETMLVTIANTPLIGAKNLLVPNASLDDGLLDIAVYPGYTKAQLLAYFAMTANETKMPDGSIQRYQARKIKVKTVPKLDIAEEGMIVGKGKARIKVLPGALRVICPEPGAGAEKPAQEAKTEKNKVGEPV